MKILQISSSRCGYCKPAWEKITQQVAPKDRLLLVMDTMDVVYDEELDEAGQEELSNKINLLMPVLSKVRSVPSFMLVNDDLEAVSGVLPGDTSAIVRLYQHHTRTEAFDEAEEE